MLPSNTHRHHVHDHRSETRRQSGPGFLSTWWRSAVRNWKRRRMIAELNLLDDWILEDIGIIRGQIPFVVAGFCDRELDMAPVAPRDQPSIVREDDRPAKNRNSERQPAEMDRLAA